MSNPYPVETSEWSILSYSSSEYYARQYSKLNGQAIHIYTRDGRCKIDSDNRGTLHKVGNRRGLVGAWTKNGSVGIDVVCTSSGACVYLSRLSALGETRNGNQRVPRYHEFVRREFLWIKCICVYVKECLRSMMRMERRRRKKNNIRMNIESINSPIPPEKLVFPSPRFVFFIDGIAVACHETPHALFTHTTARYRYIGPSV